MLQYCCMLLQLYGEIQIFKSSPTALSVKQLSVLSSFPENCQLCVCIMLVHSSSWWAKVVRYCCWLLEDDRLHGDHKLRPSVSPVLNQWPHNDVWVRVWWAVFVQFILVRRPHCASRSTTLAIPSQPTQWSRVPTGTVVEQTASIATAFGETKPNKTTYEQPAAVINTWRFSCHP